MSDCFSEKELMCSRLQTSGSMTQQILCLHMTLLRLRVRANANANAGHLLRCAVCAEGTLVGVDVQVYQREWGGLWFACETSGLKMRRLTKC